MLAALEIDALMDERSEPPHFFAFFAVSLAPFFASSIEIFFAKSYACSVCLRKNACASLAAALAAFRSLLGSSYTVRA